MNCAFPHPYLYYGDHRHSVLDERDIICLRTVVVHGILLYFVYIYAMFIFNSNDSLITRLHFDCIQYST